MASTVYQDRSSRWQNIQSGLQFIQLTLPFPGSQDQYEVFIQDLVRNLFGEGNDVFKEGEWTRAIELYTEALNIAEYADSQDIKVSTGILEKLYANRAAANRAAANRAVANRAVANRAVANRAVANRAAANRAAACLNIEPALGMRIPMRMRAEDSTAAQSVLLEKVEDLKQAAEGLQTISTTIRHLSEVAQSHLARPHLQSAKEAVVCPVCKVVMEDPVFATCCGSLVGCRACIYQWFQTSDTCPKCRAVGFSDNIHSVRGLSDVFSFFKHYD